ncbi:MAG: DUF3014 domain-containing protein [Povalibacter sp.]
MNDETKKYLWWGVPIVVAAGLIAALYYGRTHKEQPVVQQVQTAPAVEPPPATENHTNEPDATAGEPIPPLAQSDKAVNDSLSGVFGHSLDRFLVPKDLVRHVVATVDNLPRKKNSVQMWPLQPTAGTPATDGQGDSITLSDDNFARYAPLMTIVRNTDTKQLVGIYKHYYPLFQQAYQELGYPDGYFNNRLVEVIDHLLATPDVKGPIRLTQPGVFYEYADPSLEQLSSGQKLLIRMGSENAAALKLKLRELRREVAKQNR